MAPELRLVKGDLDDSGPPATFAPDRTIPVRIAQVSLVLALMAGLGAAFAASTTQMKIALGGVCVFLSIQGCWAAVAAIKRASVRYTMTTQRLEIERGLIARRRESIDLFRIRDVVLDQSLIERIRGLGTVTLYSTDQVEPTLAMRSLGHAQAIYEQLRDHAARARQQRVVQVDR